MSMVSSTPCLSKPEGSWDFATMMGIEMAKLDVSELGSPGPGDENCYHRCFCPSNLENSSLSQGINIHYCMWPTIIIHYPCNIGNNVVTIIIMHYHGLLRVPTILIMYDCVYPTMIHECIYYQVPSLYTHGIWVNYNNSLTNISSAITRDDFTIIYHNSQ